MRNSLFLLWAQYYPVHQSGAYFTLSYLRLGILLAQIIDHGRYFFDPVLGAFSLLSFFSLFFPFFWFGHLAFTYEDISIAWFNILCNKQLVQACNCEWRQKPTTSMKSESWPLMCLLCQPLFCIIFSSSCLYN